MPAPSAPASGSAWRAATSETTVGKPDLDAVMRDVFGEIGAHAAAAGTVVMLEPADPGYVAAILRVAEARDAARAVASPGFSIMLDTYQLDQVEDLIEEGFLAAEGMGRHIHLYDPSHWPPGIRDGRRLDWDRRPRRNGEGPFSGQRIDGACAGRRCRRCGARLQRLHPRNPDGGLGAGRPVPGKARHRHRRRVGDRPRHCRGVRGEGAFVLIADLSAERAEEVAAACGAAGGEAGAIAVDVAESGLGRRNDGGDGRAPRRARLRGGAVRFAGNAENTPVEAWRRVLDINLTGTFLAARAAIPVMRAGGGGSIVVISSSTGAHDALPDAVAYVASKGGATMLAKALAVDHAAEGIRVNCIAPGPTDTPMLRGLLDEAGRKAFGETLPVRRLGRAEEIAAAALFLASAEASFVTGAVLAVDGGQTAGI